MRILIDARYLDGTFSGIATYSRELVEHLSTVDEKNEYLVLVGPKFDDHLELGKNFKLLSYPPKPVSLSTLYTLGRFVDGLNVDLMHSLFPVAPLMMRTPLLVTVHDLQPFIDPDFSGRRPAPVQWAYGAFYRHVYPSTLKKAKWILNDSYHTRDTVEELFPHTQPKLIVVRPGLDHEISEPPCEDPQEVLRRYEISRPYILYYGSTRPNKNLPNMLKGFAAYLRLSGDTNIEFLLVLKRDRFYREIARTIRNTGIGDHVRVLDQVSHSDQRALLGQARAFVFATRYEGFGFPALEAMAVGVPVIAGHSGALPEICEDAARFVIPEDPTDIGNAIGELLGNEDIRREYVEAGRKRVKAFDWTATAEYVRDIYRLLV